MEVSKCWKIVEFQKISIKMKNFKTFYEAQRDSGNYLVSEIQKLHCKMSNLFCKFLLGLRLSARKSES